MSIEMLRIYGWLAGGDGEPPPTEDSKGQEPDPDGQVPPAGDDSDGGDDSDDTDDTKPMSLAAARKLRKESQQLRAAKNAAEAKLAEIEKAQMSELERAKAERDEARAALEATKGGAQQARLEAAVLSKASAFIDPAEALALLDLDEIMIDDDGKPDGRSVAAAIAKLAKAKPHLLKPGGTGEGDGGPRQPVAPKPLSAKVDEYEKQLLDAGGMVKMPGR